MCGRVKTPSELNEIRLELGVEDFEVFEYAPRINTAPTDPVPVITLKDGKRRLELMRWGLIPFWRKEAKMKVPTFNARTETVSTAASFREAWNAVAAWKRARVFADRYYRDFVELDR